MEKGIYKLKLYRRNYSIEGLFIAYKEYVDVLINEQMSLDFGECAGKYSDVQTTIERNDIELVTSDKVAIEIFEKYDFANGYNPFDCYTNTKLVDIDENEDYDYVIDTLEEIENFLK